MQATEIHAIHTSQKGGFGRSLITREDGEVPALGYVLSYADLQSALDTALEREQILVQRGAVVTAFDERATTSTCASPRPATNSARGRCHRAGRRRRQSGQSARHLQHRKRLRSGALLGQLETDTPHRAYAYERFTPEGPAALFPHGGNAYSMVWVSSQARIEELKALDDAGFLAAFQQHFGIAPGVFASIMNAAAFRSAAHGSSRVAGSIAVIGNAAQALHPVAGQGFNLGLRDANNLARLLCRHGARNQVARVCRCVREYEDGASDDVERSVGFTDFLVGAFSNDHLATRCRGAWRWPRSTCCHLRVAHWPSACYSARNK